MFDRFADSPVVAGVYILIKGIMAKIDQLASSFAATFKDEIRTADRLPNVISIPTGLPTFDSQILNCGGIPRGRVTEGCGLESSGKSTFGHFLAAAGQREQSDFTTAWLDVEGCFVAKWAKAIGQDLSQTLIPDNLYWAEDFFKYIKWCIVNGIDLVVLDCVAMLVPRIVGERSLKKDQGGNPLKDQSEGMTVDERGLKMNEMLARAKLFSQNLAPDLTSGFQWGDKRYRLSDSRTAIYFINQVRSNPDSSGYINVDTATPGGQALKHLYSSRLLFRRVAKSKQNPDEHIIRIRNIKNKVGTPFNQGEFLLKPEGGFFEIADTLVETAKKLGIVEQRGAWFYLNDTEKIQGKENVLKYLQERPELFTQMTDEYQEVSGAKLRFDDGQTEGDKKLSIDEIMKKNIKDNSGE